MLSNQRQTPRFEILRNLSRKKHTVETLASLLDITPSAVRQHLGILEKDALVTKMIERRRTGRPRYIYFLTEKADSLFPNRYDFIAEMLAAHISGEGGQEALKETFSAIGNGLISSFGVPLEGIGLEKGVAAIQAFFDEMGGESSLTKSHGVFLLTHHRCPFRALSLKHGTTCEICATVIRLSVGKMISFDRKVHGESICVHEIKDNSQNPSIRKGFKATLPLLRADDE
jgi:predicted ArsR family transcriptional regulator